MIYHGQGGSVYDITKKIDGGREGDIYQINGDTVAKIYKPDVLSARRGELRRKE